MQSQPKLKALPPVEKEDNSQPLEAPHDLEMELALLSSLMHCHESDRQVVFDNVLPIDFWGVLGLAIYPAMLKMHEEKQPFELVTLRAMLKRLKKFGTAENKLTDRDLMLLYKNPSSYVHLPHYMKQVKDISARRQVINSLGALGAAAMNLDKPIEDVHSLFSRLAKSINNTTPAGIIGETADKLEHKEFDDPRWIVDGFLPEGTTLLVAAPKIGKSYLSMNLAVAIASGGKALGKVPCEQARVVYISLDDPSERRMQKRLKQMMPEGGFPEKLHIFYKFPSAPNGIEILDNWLTENSDCKLVVVDTLGKFKQPDDGRKGVYDNDVAALTPLTDLAVKHHISILIVHHNNKGKKEDIMDEINGSQGIAGSVDNIMILKRERGSPSGTLDCMGRDFDEDKKYSLLIVRQFGLWELQGDVPAGAPVPVLSKERSQILDILAKYPRGIKTSHLKTAVEGYIGREISLDGLKKTLQRMAEAGQVSRLENGIYALPSGDDAEI